ncbi:MAG TPA: hypothetical protein VFW11_12030 [Cyclobacteriaceae bacterium]|nr:hypothetical protein [Cyclobacteriaceae bacterium]
MKTTIVVLALTAVTTVALSNRFARGNSSEQVARKVVIALKKSSPEAYTALFPTLEEFHQIMDENSVVYGETLNAAKEEFANHYENEILPALKEEFARILSEGKEKGIDWSAISYERIEYSKPQGNKLTRPLTIVFSSKGKEHHLQIDNAFILHEEWRVGQSIRLM